MRLFIFIMGLMVLPMTVSAQEQADTRIAVDEEAGVIRFIIDGEEQARLTSDGMLVRGNIIYGGTIRDGGPQAMTEHSAPALESEVRNAE